MNKNRWLVSFTLFLLTILVIPGHVLAVENSDAFNVPFMPKPELSADGLNLYNAQNIGVMVVDPNPAQSQVRIPASDLLTEASTATATFEFTYQSAGQSDPWGETCYAVPDDAKAAFVQAGIIWGNLLQSSVPIKISVCYASIPITGILGYCGGGVSYRDFTNAPRSGTWYISSLANSLAETDQDPSAYDMYLTYNKNFAWYTGTDANPPADKFDLESVALHEICHGLNFSGIMNYYSSVAQWGGGTGYPSIYDTYMRDGSGNALINASAYANSSGALAGAVTSNNLWFEGPLAMSGNGGTRVKMYAPTNWDSGSSYAHLDYNTFASGSNRLMSPGLSIGSAIHDPGPVTIGILKDLGWNAGGTSIHRLTVSPVTQNVGSGSGTTTLSVSNTGIGTMPWTAMVMSGSSWLSIASGVSGSNTGTINCSFTANTSTSARTGTIRITATGASGSPVDVTVTQRSASIVAFFASPVPDTGQTKCYDVDGNVITCPSPGQPLYGQNANYTINPMSYTKLDGSGNALADSSTSWVTVRDNVTGLIWEVKTSMGKGANYNDPHNADNTYTWYDSNPATNGGNAGTPGNGTDSEDFINALNREHFGGYSDWRLPTFNELGSIVNCDIPPPGPTIDTTYFTNTQSSIFWSSTTRASCTSGAFLVSFNNGSEAFNSNKYSSATYVRAVRGRQHQSAYVDNGNGTVTDTSSGLMWQQETPGNTFTWEQALSYCENLHLAGYPDWRLPTKKELLSLVDYSRFGPAINTLFFSDIPWPKTFPGHEPIYWSSTTSMSYWGTYCASSVDFLYGDESIQYATRFESNYVRAVRGGQAGPKPMAVSTLLWSGSDGSASDWNMDASGNKTSEIFYGPYTDWTAKTYHRNSDGTANMLWVKTDGYVSLWATMDTSGNPTSTIQYGPYEGWTAQGYHRNSNGTANMLWVKTDGYTSLWTLDASGNKTGEMFYGPYVGWTATCYHGNSDGTSNMLWVRADGYVSLWTMDAGGNPTSKMKYGPYEGWTAKSYYRNSDGTGRMLWVRTDGYVSLWNMDVSGNPISKMKYGPYQGWTAHDFD